MAAKLLVRASEFVRALPVKQRDKLMDIIADDDGREALSLALLDLLDEDYAADSRRALERVAEVARKGR